MDLHNIITSIGGVGVILLGIALMSDSIQKLAGSSFRAILTNLTGDKFKALITGMLVTTILQASSATAVATIGFASAGLISMSQALAVIFGANVGTTATAWIVAVFGVQYSIGQFSLLFVAAGMILKIIYTDKRADIGLAIAGLGLLFFGISLLREGFSQLAQTIDLMQFSGGAITGRVILFACGMLLTILMQSSSASVAVAIVAVSSGAVTLLQAQVLVIGMNAGKSIPILFAGIGATPDTKRIIAADVLFNLGTAVILFFCIPLLSPVFSFIFVYYLALGPAAQLALFHTLFNVLGVVVFTPLINPLLRYLKRFFTARDLHLTEHLDDAIAKTPPVAVETARRTVIVIALFIIAILKDILRKTENDIARRLRIAAQSLEETKHFMSKVKTDVTQAQIYKEHISVLHAIDHLASIIEACNEINVISSLKSSNNFMGMTHNFNNELDESEKALRARGGMESVDKIQRLSQHLANTRKLERIEVLKKTAEGSIDSHTALDYIEAIRFIDRLGYHIWRVARHCLSPGDSH